MFKAKVKNWREKPADEQWVYGYYVKGFNVYEEPIHIIFEPTTIFHDGGKTDGWEEIDDDTLCRCTGLTDKNGKKIWENDVVKDTDIHLLGSVEYDEEHGMYVINEVNDGYQNFQEFWSCTEVIGNIFDNPKLKKEV